MDICVEELRIVDFARLREHAAQKFIRAKFRITIRRLIGTTSTNSSSVLGIHRKLPSLTSERAKMIIDNFMNNPYVTRERAMEFYSSGSKTIEDLLERDDITINERVGYEFRGSDKTHISAAENRDWEAAYRRIMLSAPFHIHNYTFISPNLYISLVPTSEEREYIISALNSLFVETRDTIEVWSNKILEINYRDGCGVISFFAEVYKGCMRMVTICIYSARLHPYPVVKAETREFVMRTSKGEILLTSSGLVTSAGHQITFREVLGRDNPRDEAELVSVIADIIGSSG